MMVINYSIPFFTEPRVVGRGCSGTTDFMWSINDDFSFTATNYFYGSLELKLEHRTIIYNITVGNPVTSLRLNTDKLDLKVNENEKLIATVMPSDATFRFVDWESSNPDVATIRGGIVTGISKGSATITVTSTNGLKAKCIVNVEMLDDLSSIGDVNGDEIVNVKDRIYLARYLAKWDGYENINVSGADVNEDGTVDVQDRIILARHLAKWGGYDSLPYMN